jgi:hypothetical protein
MHLPGTWPGPDTTSGTPIFGICLVYTTYIPCICSPHQYTWNIHGISMDIPWISNGVDIRGTSMDIPRISTKCIPGISMDIHGVSFDVNTWYIRGISMDIPSFLSPDFSAGPSCWSHSMRTRVWVIKSVLFHAPPWQLCQGIRRPTKGSLLLSPRRRRLALRGTAGRLRGDRLGGLVLVTLPRCCVVSTTVSAAVAAAVAAAASAAVAAVSSGGGSSGDGGSAGFFPGSVACDDFFPVQDLQGW